MGKNKHATCIYEKALNPIWLCLSSWGKGWDQRDLIYGLIHWCPVNHLAPVPTPGKDRVMSRASKIPSLICQVKTCALSPQKKSREGLRGGDCVSVKPHLSICISLVAPCISCHQVTTAWCKTFSIFMCMESHSWIQTIFSTKVIGWEQRTINLRS